MTFQAGNNLYANAVGIAPENVEVPFVSDRAPTEYDIIGTTSSANWPIGKRWTHRGVATYELMGYRYNSGVLLAQWSPVGTVNPVVLSVSGLNGVTATPTTGNVEVLGINATTSSVGVASFNPLDFTVDINGEVSLLSATQPIEQINLQAGITPCVETGGVITFNGATIAAGSTPVRTNGTATSTMALEVQLSQSIVSSDATKVGLSAFDSSAFQVDADGFVQLVGGGIPAISFDVQSSTSPGVDPVTPNASGVVTVNGQAVANHDVPIETRSRALNTYNVEVQYATTNATTEATKSGIAHFDSSQFTVDANGFVSLSGGGAAVDSIGIDATSGSGTNPVEPTAGLITVNGALVAASTNPIRTVSTAPSVYQIQAQISQALAAADSTKVGLSNFDSASFSVDSDGFVSLLSPSFSSIVVQSFLTAGAYTYTPTSGMAFCFVEAYGGGGGGGGAVTCSTGEGAVGAGGGAGAYIKAFYDAATIGASQSGIVGSGGAGGTSAGTGGSGGLDTTFGSLLEADGANGGQGTPTPSSVVAFKNGGNGGLPFTSTGSINGARFSGQQGGNGVVYSNIVVGGTGGASFGTAGGRGGICLPGNSEVGAAANFTFGAGGGGAACYEGTGVAGGNGAQGCVIVTEFII